MRKLIVRLFALTSVAACSSAPDDAQRVTTLDSPLEQAFLVML